MTTLQNISYGTIDIPIKFKVENFNEKKDILERRLVDVEVIRKEVRDKSFLFLKWKQYMVVFKPTDSNKVVQRQVQFSQYHDLNVGDKKQLALYSVDGASWYYSAEDTLLAQHQGR